MLAAMSVSLGCQVESRSYCLENWVGTQAVVYQQNLGASYNC